MRYSWAMNPVLKLAGRLFFENPAQRQSYSQLRFDLERGGAAILARFQRAGESLRNRDLTRHIIAIEGWGGNRLRVLLGQKPFSPDGNAQYKPGADTPWAELLERFKTTRAVTLSLCDALESMAGDTGTVPHNAMGELSGKGWLRYLTVHANMESRKLRG